MTSYAKLKKKNSHTEKAIEYILTREVEELESLTVERIANNLNISRYHLWRSFKTEKKITLEEYMFRVKIHWAAFLIQERTDLTIKQISEKIGYYSYDYFLRIFKEYFGTTPGKYREYKVQNIRARIRC